MVYTEIEQTAIRHLFTHNETKYHNTFCRYVRICVQAFVRASTPFTLYGDGVNLEVCNDDAEDSNRSRYWPCIPAYMFTGV